MALIDLDLPADRVALPSDVRAFLDEADRRIERFQRDSRVPAFVPSDFPGAYGVLHALSESGAAPGGLFCEWGSGFGVVACLAAMLDYDAHGIEIDDGLVTEARRLAADFDLPVEFLCGSFIPAGAERSVGRTDRFNWLTTRAGDPEGEWGLGPADFDVVFAFPWPDEERVIADLFHRHAAAGAVLVTYHEGQDFRVRRKAARR
jgi:hypothetical protein